MERPGGLTQDPGWLPYAEHALSVFTSEQVRASEGVRGLRL